MAVQLKEPAKSPPEESKPEAEIPAIMADIAERSQKMLQDFMAKGAAAGPSMGMGSGNGMATAFMDMTRYWMTNPTKLAEAQVGLWQDYAKLWQNTAERMMGHKAEPVITPQPDDRRFKDAAWKENEVFDFIKQSYLLTSNWVQDLSQKAEGLDEATAKKANFAAREFMNALSPTNFVMTNPEVLRETIESRGDNLVRGFRNLLSDLERGGGQLDIKMADTESFEVGKNLGVTPGKVVYRNELMELIQYAPTTDAVYQTPLLIIPPWINKYYILDLNDKKSYIKWAVEQGHSVFVISWVNPGPELADKNFEDYMLEGPLAALDAIEKATGEEKVNVVGYCIGGTLLAAALAWMADKKDDRISSATFLTTLVDFKDVGEIDVFIDKEQIAALEEKMEEKGYLEGDEMKATFSMLRSNDLIWSFVVNNYLLGKEPFPFDLLYWNGDSTRMPKTMHGFYLREMYLHNQLSKPGALTLAGRAIDLSKVKAPCYLLSTREDHIAPWQSTYQAMNIYSGSKRFVLAASGHIAGVINPPAADKYCYWTNNRTAKTPDGWLEGADEHEGSWWPDWRDWMKLHAGQKNAKPRIVGKGKLKALCDAPGTYAKMD